MGEIAMIHTFSLCSHEEVVWHQIETYFLDWNSKARAVDQLLWPFFDSKTFKHFELFVSQPHIYFSVILKVKNRLIFFYEHYLFTRDTRSYLLHCPQKMKWQMTFNLTLFHFDRLFSIFRSLVLLDDIIYIFL